MAETIIFLSHDRQTIAAIAKTFPGQGLRWATDARGLLGLLRAAETATPTVLLDDALSTLNVLETCKQIRDAKPTSRRIVISATGDLSVVVAGLHNGLVQQVVYKPLTPAALLAAVKAAENIET